MRDFFIGRNSTIIGAWHCRNAVQIRVSTHTLVGLRHAATLQKNGWRFGLKSATFRHAASGLDGPHYRAK